MAGISNLDGEYEQAPSHYDNDVYCECQTGYVNLKLTAQIKCYVCCAVLSPETLYNSMQQSYTQLPSSRNGRCADVINHRSHLCIDIKYIYSRTFKWRREEEKRKRRI